MSSFDDIQACNSRMAMETMTSAIHNATAQFDPSLCDCPKKCLEIMYVVETRHNTNSYTFGIEVYVAGVWITIMEEVATYNLFKAFADLGGVIGLWLGTCLLGIIEFFSSCFTQLWLNIRGKKIRSLNNNGIKSRILIARNVKVKQNASPLTDYPGLNRVLKEDSSVWARILWLIAFMTATTLCINQCAQQIFYYFSDPSTTNIFYTLNETIAFPSITICPKSKDGLLPAIHPQIVKEMIGSPHNNVNVVELIRKKNFTINELWNASSVYLFGNHMKIENIQRNWYIDKVSTVTGNCLNFSPRNTSKYIGLHTRKILHIYSYSNVKLIIVHPGEELPLIRYLAQSYASEAKGKAGWISERTFRITQVSYRNTWKSPCEDHQQVVQCLVKCIEKETYAKIVQGYCRLPYMNDANTSTPVCKSEEDLYTMLNATLSVIKTFRQEDCLCSEICRQIIYSTEYIDERIIMARGLLSVELGVRDNRVMVVEESAAYTEFALFADIGGSLGLFTGLCILNVFDIIGACCSKLRIVIRRVIGCCWKENNNLSSNRFVHTVVIQDLHSKDSTGSEYTDINFPGFSKSADKKSPLGSRLLWFIISTGACILCGYQFVERIQYYISDPTEVRMFYTYNKSVTFPLILICPFQDYSIYTLRDNAVHFLEYWNTSQLQDTYISVSINEIDDPFKGRFGQRIRNQSTHIAYYTNTRNHPVAITKEATSSGVCLVTEISNPLVYEGHRTSISVDMLLISSGSTWMAYFSRDDKQILNYMTKKRTFVATKIIKAKISLQITEVFHHNTHKNPCKNGEESATCVTNCLEEKIYSRINTKCRLPFMKESKTYPLCHNWTEYLDIKKASAEVLEAFDKKECNCPHNCKEIFYSIEEFSVRTGHSIYLQLKLHVPDNRIAVIQEKSAYGFIRLLSDLGGSLGLFFGIGILHMFEMMAAVATKFRT